MKRKYSLPFGKSVGARVCDASFHASVPGLERCIDFGLPDGTPIRAARGGIVVARESRYRRNHATPAGAHRANRVLIRHADGERSVYAHLQWRSVRVRVGQRVQRGQVIGLSGRTGYATHPHLHFGVYAADGDNIKIRFREPLPPRGKPLP